MDALRIVLGLGNPGTRYERTRHNIGFWVLDALARSRDAAFVLEEEWGRRVWTAETTIGSQPVVLAKPRTYMNRSGRAAAALVREYGTMPQQFLVVCDDADLELGRLRIRPEGRAGGHNGLRSLIDFFGTQAFPRLKLGVRGAGRDDQDLADYVLEPFLQGEQALAQRLAEVAVEAVQAVFSEGLTSAMNRYNGLRLAPEGGSRDRGTGADVGPPGGSD